MGQPYSARRRARARGAAVLLTALVILAWLVPRAPATPAVYAADSPFPAPTFLAGSGRNTKSIVVGDLNGDGVLDLVLGNLRGSSQVYLGTGNGHFASPTDLPGDERQVSSIAVGDLNGDGTLDMVFVNSNAASQVYLGKGDGSFAAPTDLPGHTSYTASVALGDLNGDSALDLVLVSNGIQIYLGKGDGSFAAPTDLPGHTSYTASVALGDLNGDAVLDLVVGNSDQLSEVYLGKGDGSFAAPIDLPDSDRNTTSVALGDVNGDGALDLVVANGGTADVDGIITPQLSQVYLGKGDGSFAAPTDLPDSDHNTTSIALGDVNGDGALDLVLGHSSYLGYSDGSFVHFITKPSQVYLGNGDGSFAAPTDLPGSAGSTSSVTLGDLDGNGVLDLVLGNAGGQLSQVYFSDKSIGFHSPIELPNSELATVGVAVGDLNGDGALDLVCVNSYLFFSKTSQVYLGKGDGTFDTPTDLPGSGGYVSSVAVGDLNGDGALDIVLGRSDAYGERHGNQIYLGKGDGTFGTPTELPDSGRNTASVAIGDLNGDGALDLVFGNGGQPSQVYLGKGDGTFGTPTELPDSGRNTASVAIGDLNGDSTLDLLLGNADSYNEYQLSQVYLGKGDGTFTAPADLPGSSHGVSSVALGDLNGDGALDLVVGHESYLSTDHTVFPKASQVYLGTGDGSFAAPTDLPGSGRFTRSVALGDINGDSNLDLVLGNVDFYGQPSQVYLGKGDGSFANPTDLPHTEFGTYSVATGDLDGNGSLDLIAGSYRSNHVFLNTLGNTNRLPNGPPSIAITRPGPTPNANFLSTPTILDSRIIPIHYTLADLEGKPVGAVRAFFSLDGGGSWRQAIAATGTITRNLATSPAGVAHTFNWDIFASGVFGQSDNVVVRIEAYGVGSGTSRYDPPPLRTWSHTVRLPIAGNGRRARGLVAGPYQRPYASATTFPFRVRGSQVRVLRDGRPQPGALVYRLAGGQPLGGSLIGDAKGKPFATDPQGYLRGRGEVRPGDRLLAVAPISSTASYTLYATNGTPTLVGTDTFTVTASGVQTLAVSLDHPLILFNIDVSLEWDASSSPSYLQQLQFNLQRASQYLYDFTDGQVALGRIMVHQNADDWAFSDVVIHATNRLRPFAAQGGIVLTPTVDPQHPDIVYDTGQVHIGATWNRYGAAGQSLGDDWSIILAHELSHYLLYQDDSYLGLNADGFLVAVRSCTGSAMGDLYTSPDATEFVADQAHWNAACADTLANQTLHRTEWQTIDTWYPALHQPAAINSGPGTMPFDLTGVSVAPPITPTQALADPTFYLDYANEQTSSNEAHAFLERDGKYIVDVGSPFGGQNRLLAHGAQPGDRLCVFDRPRQQFGCETIALGDDRLALRQDANWAPVIQLTPVTSRTFDLTVEGLPAGLMLNARLFPEFGPGSTVIGLAQVGSVYTGSFQLDEPALVGNVQVWANEPATEEQPRRETIVSYVVGGNPGQSRGGGGQSRGGGGQSRGGGGQSRGGGGQSRGGGAPLVSPDGQMIFFTPNPIVFQPGQFYTIQGTAGLPPLPLGKTVIGQSDSLVATAGTPVITGSISFQYLESDVLVAGVNESQLTIHFWDGTTWRALATIRDPYVNLASARSQGPGIYALMAGVSTARIESITPTWATNDTTTTLTIHGSGFLPPVRVSLVGPDTTYTLPVTSAFSTTVTTVISAGLEAREYQLVITNGDGGSSAPVPFALYSPSSARFYDFFESGAGKWQLDGEWGIVALPDGNRAMTDSPAGNYNSAIPPAATRTTQITSQPFSLDALANPVLTFRHDYVLARLGSSQDIARVEISTDNGATWATLASYSGGGIYGAAAGPQDAPDLEWTNVNWKNVSLNLSGYSGTVRLRFSLEVDQTVSDKGWVIDDVMVRSGP